MTRAGGQPLRLGIMGCSEFAVRTMIAAIRTVPELQLVAVASRTAAKAADYAQRFACEGIAGYEQLLAREDIDGIYIALPTGLNVQWVAKALEAGKHLLVEKSFAPDFRSTHELVGLARRRNRLVTENISFHYHLQYAWTREQIAKGALGDVHLLRANFSFPPLKPGNFRYDPALGGGALLDTGAYMVKVTRLFLGEELTLLGSSLRYDPSLGVDIEGTAAFVAQSGAVAQVAFGFNSFYQCNWELVGSLGKLVVERGYTAPPTLATVVRLERQGQRDEFTLAPENHYRTKLVEFARATRDASEYPKHWDDVESQSRHLDAIRQAALRL